MQAVRNKHEDKEKQGTYNPIGSAIIPSGGNVVFGPVLKVGKIISCWNRQGFRVDSLSTTQQSEDRNSDSGVGELGGNAWIVFDMQE